MISPTLNVPQARFLSMPINLKPILLVLARAKHGLGVAAYARGFGSIQV